MLLAAMFSFAIVGCKKDKGEVVDPIVMGCTDSDSPLYNPLAIESDGSCKAAVLTSIDIMVFPEDNDGSAWDGLAEGNAKPDLKLKIGRDEAMMDVVKESMEFTNAEQGQSYHVHINDPIEMKNETLYFQLHDDDNLNADDLMGSGMFNSFEGFDASTNKKIVTSDDGKIKFSMNYELQ